MNRYRWLDAAAIALAVAVVVGVAFAIHSEGTAQITVDPSTVSIERPQPSESPRPSALYIGDSYTLGTGPREMSYGCMSAVRMGWYCNLSALPGTGFISGGPANRFVIDPYHGISTSFIERIPQLAAVYQPDVLFFDGGRNDRIAPVEDLFLAMRTTIDEASQMWPTAKIVVIRPRFLDRPSDDLGFNDAFFQRLQAAAPKVMILDPIKRFAGTDTSNMVAKDGMHPNRLGELALASAFLDSLSSRRLAIPT
jgi:lysophospholipase L1-like esterase